MSGGRIVRRVEKDHKRSKWVANSLEDLRDNTVIVEGKHDVEKLRSLGIDAHTFDSVLHGCSSLPHNKKIIIFVDDDKGGETKRAKLISMLESRNAYHVVYHIDESLGRRMLTGLNITSVEQICEPVQRALGSAEGRRGNRKELLRNIF